MKKVRKKILPLRRKPKTKSKRHKSFNVKTSVFTKTETTTTFTGCRAKPAGFVGIY